MKILMPPLPYGPGFAHSFTNDLFRKKLAALKTEPKINHQVKDLVSFILSGEAASSYAKFKKDPQEFNYQREYLEPGK